MADDIINPVLPVSKTRNTLKNKKKPDKNKQPAQPKPVPDKSGQKKNGSIDTYA